MKTTLLILSLVLAYQQSTAQALPDGMPARARAIVKSHFGPNYESCDVYDVDFSVSHPPSEPSSVEGYIMEDPSKQLRHCILVIYAQVESVYSGGYSLDSHASLAIIRNDSVIWHSAAFLYDCCAGSAGITGFCDLNNDGTTDILISWASGSHGEIEDLWIVSPDSKTGRLLNATDEYNRSTIVGSFDTYEILSADKRGCRSIRTIDPNSETLTTITYSWNGKQFVRKR